MFEGKTVFVSGAGSGIGRATALLFASHGAKVAVADIDGEQARITVDMIALAGGQALAVLCDVRQSASLEEATRRTVEWGGALHHAFNNAGIVGQHVNVWDEDAVANTIDVNLMGVIWAMKFQVAHMLDHGGGTIVNTASIAGLSGNVGAMDYTAAKHGVVGFTQAAAMKYGPRGIRINVVCPGLIRTGMTPSEAQMTAETQAVINRLSPITNSIGEPEDVAQAACWLSSPLSKFIYGVALPVDGGFSIN